MGLWSTKLEHANHRCQILIAVPEVASPCVGLPFSVPGLGKSSTVIGIFYLKTTPLWDILEPFKV
jgi:hypothetical protein